MQSVKQIVKHLKNPYISTLAAWFVWVVFLDDNNLRIAVSNHFKRTALEADTLYYSQKIKEVKREREEVLGNQTMVEKWAREKYRMRKPGEEVFVIVDENDRSLER